MQLIDREALSTVLHTVNAEVDPVRQLSDAQIDRIINNGIEKIKLCSDPAEVSKIICFEIMDMRAYEVALKYIVKYIVGYEFPEPVIKFKPFEYSEEITRVKLESKNEE